MAFDSLSEKLQNVFKNLRSKGRLTEDDVKTALREVKMALLEADVNFRVVKKFVKDVQERAIGQDVMSGLNPGQMVIKIVNEEMVNLMGSETTEIAFRPGKELTVIMMVGLQPVRRQRPPRSQASLRPKVRRHFLPHVMCIVRLQSNSCRSTERSRVWRSSPWEIRTARQTLQKLQWNMQRKMITMY